MWSVEWGGVVWCVVPPEDVHWHGVSAFAMASMVTVGLVAGISGAWQGGVGWASTWRMR